MFEESKQLFHLKDGMTVNNFHSACTPHGDELILKAHQAARDAIKAMYPDTKVGIQTIRKMIKRLRDCR